MNDHEVTSIYAGSVIVRLECSCGFTARRSAEMKHHVGAYPSPSENAANKVDDFRAELSQALAKATQEGRRGLVADVISVIDSYQNRAEIDLHHEQSKTEFPDDEQIARLDESVLLCKYLKRRIEKMDEGVF